MILRRASRLRVAVYVSERRQVLLRVDPAVHDALTRWANDESRSVNAHVEMLLPLGDTFSLVSRSFLVVRKVPGLTVPVVRFRLDLEPYGGDAGPSFE